MCNIVAGTLALGLVLPAAAADHGPEMAMPPAEQYQALLKEYQKAQDDFSKAYAAARTAAEREQVKSEKYRPASKFAPRFLELAEKHPQDSIAVTALVWVVDRTANLAGENDGPTRRAMALLLRDHVRSD